MRTATHLSFPVAACTLLATLLVPLPSFAQKADVKAEVLKDWTDMKGTMVKISSAMPDDKFGFKSTPAQRSYGEQIMHIAGANANFLKSLGGKAAAPALAMKATSKADIIKVHEQPFDSANVVIDEQRPDPILV